MHTINNFHEPLRVEDDLKPGSERVFGIVFAAVFAIVAFYPLLTSGTFRLWAIVVAALLIIVAIVCPRILRPANLIWFRVGLLLHKFTNPIILGAIYFVVITPTGLFMRLAGRDILKLQFDSGANSYWIKREPPGPNPEHMNRQF